VQPKWMPSPAGDCAVAGLDPTAFQVGAEGDEVQVAATQILQVAGIAAYHTSVILGTKEYYFDADGIASAPALWSHFVGNDGDVEQEICTEVFTVGRSPLSGAALVQGLEVFFYGGSYDVLLKNCNAFTDAALYFLTRRRLDPRFSRLERLIGGTRPLSTKLLAAVLRSVIPGGDAEGLALPQDYMPNPLAENFSVEDVIARCDALDAASAYSQRRLLNRGGRMAARGAAGYSSCGSAPCLAFCDPLGGCLGPSHVVDINHMAVGTPRNGSSVRRREFVDEAAESVIFEAHPVFNTPSNSPLGTTPHRGGLNFHLETRSPRADLGSSSTAPAQAPPAPVSPLVPGAEYPISPGNRGRLNRRIVFL